MYRHLMWPILFIIRPDRYNDGVSAMNPMNRQAPSVLDVAPSDLKNQKRNVSTAPHRNPIINKTVKKANIRGCLSNLYTSLAMEVFLGMLASGRNIIDIPVIMAQTLKPTKHGVKLISFCCEPYLFKAKGKLASVFT